MFKINNLYVYCVSVKKEFEEAVVEGLGKTRFKKNEREVKKQIKLFWEYFPQSKSYPMFLTELKRNEVKLLVHEPFSVIAHDKEKKIITVIQTCNGNSEIFDLTYSETFSEREVFICEVMILLQ